MDAPGRRFLVEHMTSVASSLIGAGDRHNQIQLRAGIDNPPNAAKNSIHFAKRSETIDVNGLQARGLREQFFVGHVGCSPHWWRGQSGTTVDFSTLNFHPFDNFLFRVASCSKFLQLRNRFAWLLFENRASPVDVREQSARSRAYGVAA